MGRWLLLCALAGCSFDASGVLRADAARSGGNDSIGLGDGRDGALTVTTEDVEVNQASPLTADSQAGTDRLTVADGTFVAPGDVVMAWQTAAAIQSTLGDQRPVDLASVRVGHYELAVVASADADSIVVTESLRHGYRVPGAQVIRVPQYTDVQITAGSEIEALTWNGSTGGIAALLIRGTLTNNGEIDANSRGFRGGAPITDQTRFGCVRLDEPSPAGGLRGEGLVAGVARETDSGYGNRFHGAGGGNCSDAGGGGGGHAGVGGRGARTFVNDGTREVGGLGGAPLRYESATHLAMGGGGGAGHANGDDQNKGGDGGAVIWIRADAIAGEGVFKANGESGGDANANGGGGAAAGGLIVLDAPSVVCGSARANGGSGGDTSATTDHGGGGGGSPGFVVITGSGTCDVETTYGLGGNNQSGTDHGSTPFCGNNTVFGDEQCDDGNQIDGDGCSAGCVNE